MRTHRIAGWGLIFCALAPHAAIRAAAGADARQLRVVATIKPVHALVAKVMAGVGEPTLLISGQASPHTYAMKPSDVGALHAADVFFRVSENVEPFTARVIRSLPEAVRVVTLADAPGIERLAVRTGYTFEPHVHDDHDEPAGAGHDDHDEGHDRLALIDHGRRRDGHIWLDPENARKMVAEIARVLSEAAPESAPKFDANAQSLIAEIGALDAEIARELAPVKAKPFVVLHDAYQYFERRYGLNAVGSITVSPEVQPSARRLKEIRAKIAKLGAACVFAEPGFQPGLVAAVIEDTGAHAATLDPEGLLVVPGPEAYTTLLRSLARSLRGCLAAGS